MRFPDTAAQVARLERLAGWLDSRFRVPGTNIRFGLDGLIGLIPGVGDTATSLASLYLIAEAARIGVPRHYLVRMIANVGLDLLVGAIPIIGDLFDFGFKANRRNIALLKRHTETQERR